ncbi:TPA: hypothetical protein U1582_001072 [Streptococcus suis]|nr:hypothetical protein [Streptococcus suis]NQO04004.1 hypothetical protein [Streptococcus suis]NQO30138.1 hypothetical protein [Streptococcus suis]NQO68945.1 hypothetical protein [Streptococcus suis]NQO76892.1 hypothetical protein [Streptococcus suis]
MTTQVSIFEEVNNNGQIMQVVTTTTFHGQPLNIYGSEQEPYFLAKDVADWIGHSKSSVMIDTVDDDEKLRETIFTSGQNREMWFLTENGLYEVLFQSRKPKAKEFKKVVKNILKEIRTQGYYMQGKLIEPTHPTIKAPSTLAEAEQNYINALAQSIIEADSMDEKKELADRLTSFMQEVVK